MMTDYSNLRNLYLAFMGLYLYVLFKTSMPSYC